MSLAIDHVYRYVGESSLVPGAVPRLELATSGGVAPHPHFFRGDLVHPAILGASLRALSRIVAARFYTPPAMLARILREADPVVTSGGGLLRFEAFSACASAYARVDLDPTGYHARHLSSGTTNVDFGDAMRGALAAMRDGDRAALSVGRDEVELCTGGARVIERRVALPARWLRSFVEVQSYLSSARPVHRISGADALRFLRTLPRSSTSRQDLFVVPNGRSVRTTTVPASGAIVVRALERLRVLEDLAPLASAMRIHVDDAGEASVWELELRSVRFTLALSRTAARGFSGEGRALVALASEHGSATPSVEPRVRAALKWQAALDASALARELGTNAREVERALLRLGARGLVGYDVGTRAYFHRELPYDLAAIHRLHPRLEAARELVATQRARLIRSPLPEHASAKSAVVEVESTDVIHRVTIDGERVRCTCPWHAKHQGARGPCKHALAALLVVERLHADEEDRA